MILNMEEVGNEVAELMSDIADLSNKFLALTHKVDSILKSIEVLRNNNDKFNEVLNIIHNMNFERSMENNNIFNVMFPDIIRRLTEMENIKREETEKERRELENERKHREILSINIRDLEDIDTRAKNCLMSENINSIGDIMNHNESFYKIIPNFGLKSLKNLKEALNKYGLYLKVK